MDLEFDNVQCCFCGGATDWGRSGDGLRINLFRGGPNTRQVFWAHVECLRERLSPECAGYLLGAFGDDATKTDADWDAFSGPLVE
jgi:hypothetical protein